MPDNKKKMATAKKSTVVKSNSSTAKKKALSSSKKVEKKVEVASEKKNVTKEKVDKKVSTSKTNIAKVTDSGKKKTAINDKTTAKSSKKKTTTKKAPKSNTIQEIKEIPKVEQSSESKKKIEKIEKKSKKQEKVNNVESENISHSKKEEVKQKTKLGFFAFIREKFKKKKIKPTRPAKAEKKKEKSKKKESKKSTKSNIFITIREKLRKKKEDFKSLKDKKQKNDGKVHKTKQNKNNSSFVFTKKTKKWLITVAVICVVIIILEVSYIIYHQIDVDRNTIYYDSLNSLVIDDTDIVAVGSSNFRYSKHNDYTKGLEKAKFIKYDKNGKIIFEKMYDKGINTTFSSIISVNDGYVVVGSGEFSEQEQLDGGREAIIVKYDKDGNVIWEKFYQVVTNTRFNKVIATNDGYIAIGQSIYANMEMGNHTTGGGIIVKYDKDGNEVWHNNHGGMKSGNFNDIVEVNGNFYVVGKDATDSANVVKYDKNGKYQWHKNYSYTDGIGFTGIAYLDNALYVVGSKKILPEGTGDEDNRDTTNTDALLIKYDLSGKIIFEKDFGGSNYERYNSILVYRDDLYVVGHTTSKDAGLKIDTDGELMTGILVRYDKNGNILKKESLGGSNDDNLTDIVTDSVSLYISAYSNSENGNITTSKSNGKDYFGKVIKLDFKFRTLMVK